MSGQSRTNRRVRWIRVETAVATYDPGLYLMMVVVPPLCVVIVCGVKYVTFFFLVFFLGTRLALLRGEDRQLPRRRVLRLRGEEVEAVAEQLVLLAPRRGRLLGLPAPTHR
jgi:hypothetical protein